MLGTLPGFGKIRSGAGLRTISFFRSGLIILKALKFLRGAKSGLRIVRTLFSQTWARE